MHRHTKNIAIQGVPIKKASKALIMVHGRGDTAAGILSLADYLKVDGFALLAPQANDNSWYPFSFLAPTDRNEPGLSTGLEVVGQTVDDILRSGLKAKDIYFLGFSQGACLTSEFLARNADRYGGAFLYSGGLIGEQIDRSNYKGDFQEMPLLLGCSDVDPHIPLQRVQDSIKIFAEMGADITERIYPNGPHTILQDEVELTNLILEKTRAE